MSALSTGAGSKRTWRTLVVPTFALAASGSTTLGLNLVLARELDPSQYGQIVRAFAVAMAIAQISMAGIAPAAARLVAQGSDQAARFGRAPGAIRIVVGVSFLTSLLYIPLAVSGLVPEGGWYLFGGLLLSWIYAIYFGIKSILFALDRVHRYAIFELISDVVFFAVLAAVVGRTAEASLMAPVIAYALFILLASRYVRARARERSRVVVDRALLHYSGLALIATYASVARFPIIVAVAGLVGGSLLAAPVALILSLAMPFFLVPQAAGAITFAEVAREPGSAARRVPEMVRLVGFLAASSAVLAALFAHPALEVVGGESYGSEATALAVVLLALVPQLATIPIGNAAAAGNGVRATATISLIGFAISVAGATIAVPAFDALGAAVAVATASVVSAVLLAWYGIRRGMVRFTDFQPTILIMLAGVIAVSSSSGHLVEAVVLAMGVLGAIGLSRIKPTRLRQAVQ